jgi:tRNA A-37 threonylcarbamoyl transferase component Bud32
MLSVQNKLNYPAVRVKLAGGIRGIAALTDSAGRVLSKDDWIACLSEQGEFERNPQEVLKQDGSESVIVKTLKVGSARINAIVKTRLEKNYCDGLWSCMWAHRALRNFRKAVLLKNAGITAEIPLAALWEKKQSFTKKSIYITEYVSDSASLHWFAKRDLPTLTDLPAVKKYLAHQLAGCLADLHCNGLWHRDAKPSNILVHKDQDGRYKLTLIDLDGIKPYCGLRTFSRRFRPFAHLAALRLVSPLIYRTDCLRTFKIYCNLTGVGKAVRKRFFRRLVNGLTEKRISALKSKGRIGTDIAPAVRQ